MTGSSQGTSIEYNATIASQWKVPRGPPCENRPHGYSDHPKRVEPVRLDPIANLIQVRHCTENMRESQSNNQRTEYGDEFKRGHLQGNQAIMSIDTL